MPVSTPLSLRLPASVAEELTRLARLTGRPVASVAARLIEEALRMRAIPGIAFVDTPMGRMALVAGTGLQVWEMCDLLASYGGDRQALLSDFPHLSERQVESAVHYRAQYAEEIDAAQEENRVLAKRLEAGSYPGVRVEPATRER